MPTYLLEAFLPRSRLPRLADVAVSAYAAAHALRVRGHAVHLVGAIYRPADETCFFIVDAADRRVLDELCDAADRASSRGIDFARRVLRGGDSQRLT